MIFHFDNRESDSPLVEFVWRSQSDADIGEDASFISEAENHWEMVITEYQGQVTLSIRGPETVATPSPVPEDAEFLGIVFKHGTFLSNISKKQLVNDAIHLSGASGQKFWLQGTAWEIPTFENVDSFISRLVREGTLVYDPIVDAVLNNQPPDMSQRTLQRRFLQATGLTQGTFIQIDRAKHAVTLLRQGMPILDVVHEAGYFDQPHLTRSLKQFIGQTPAQVIPIVDFK